MMRRDPAALPQVVRELVGQTIASRYLVEDVIGIGGMAIVLRGRHLALERPVAIKILRPDYADNLEIAARFDREARATSSFDHPNCRQVYDCGYTDGGLKFMAMQLLEGRELASVIGHRLPASQVVALTMQILDGLEHAHKRGVVHRDLKPDNVFVTRDHDEHEVLKLVDFGIAKIVDDAKADGLTTKVGAVVGTPAYMSPEQALGEEIDERADLYAVGVILFELLTGTPPFFSSSARELMRLHVEGKIPPLPPHVPPLLTGVLTKLLAKKREQRYASAGDARAALQRVAATLRNDPTPWVKLLELDRSRGVGVRELPSQQRHLHAVDDALRKLLALHTPIAKQSLRPGIATPVRYEWTFDELDAGDLASPPSSTPPG